MFFVTIFYPQKKKNSKKSQNFIPRGAPEDRNPRFSLQRKQNDGARNEDFYGKDYGIQLNILSIHSLLVDNGRCFLIWPVKFVPEFWKDGGYLVFAILAKWG